MPLRKRNVPEVECLVEEDELSVVRREASRKRRQHRGPIVEEEEAPVLEMINRESTETTLEHATVSVLLAGK